MKQGTRNARQQKPLLKLPCVLCTCLMLLACSRAQGPQSSRAVLTLGQWQAVVDPATVWGTSWHGDHPPLGTASPGKQTCLQHTMFLNHSLRWVLHSQESCSSTLQSDHLLHIVQSTCTAPNSHRLDARLVYTVNGTDYPVYGCATAKHSSTGLLYWCDYGPQWRSKEGVVGTCIGSHTSVMHGDNSINCSQLQMTVGHLDMNQAARALACNASLEIPPPHALHSGFAAGCLVIWLLYTMLHTVPAVVAVVVGVLLAAHIAWKSIRWLHESAPCASQEVRVLVGPPSLHTIHWDKVHLDVILALFGAAFECVLWAVYYCFLLPSLFCGTALTPYIPQVCPRGWEPGPWWFALGFVCAWWVICFRLNLAVNGWAMRASNRRLGNSEAIQWLDELNEMPCSMKWQFFKVVPTDTGHSYQRLGEEELHLTSCRTVDPIHLPFPITQSPELFRIKVTKIDCQPADDQADSAWQEAKRRLEQHWSTHPCPHGSEVRSQISVMNQTEPSAIVVNDGRSSFGNILMQPWVVRLCACFGLGVVWRLWAAWAVPVLILKLVKQYSVDPAHITAK